MSLLRSSTGDPDDQVKVPDGALAFLVQANRYVLVLATTVLGIAGSRVASDPKSLADWLIVSGAALALFVSDVCREAMDTASRLRTNTKEQRTRARADAFRARAPRITPLLFLLSVVLPLGGLAIAAHVITFPN